MASKIVTQEVEVAGKKITLEHGRFASLAGSAILARSGDTVVLVTVVASSATAQVDFFPLTVEYQERLYAGGRIKGSRWVKREGRPTDEEIVKARLIDRSIRPLFPKNFKKEVQVIATVLSVDGENDPDVLSVIATSASLATSSIPWDGPIAALRVGVKDGTYFANPTSSELKFSELDLVVVLGKKSVFMIEAGANQVSKEKILGALAFASGEVGVIIEAIEELVKKVGIQAGLQKEKVGKIDDNEIVSQIEKKWGAQIDEFARQNASKEGALGGDLMGVIIKELGEEKASLVGGAIEKVMRMRVREKILNGERLDGRKLDEIRPIGCSVGILPRTHGSAVFERGQTQVLSTVTLGSPGLEQLIETAEGDETKRFMHHYSMPPYSLGETGRVGYPSRREIGHGALVERAILPVIPAEVEFPYAIRVVSEVMSSNGSTSMASTCASTMALMDSGVPIKSPVSGIAMGLVVEGGKVAILSDIMGIEDGSGDMDLKVAGTKDGITAVQMDVKTQDLGLDILEKALEQAEKGRLFILEKMLSVIASPRLQVSAYAPKVVVLDIPKDKIGEVIGPGGQMIRKIMAATGATVDVEDKGERGSVAITGVGEDQVKKAREWVEGLIKEVQVDEIYEGEVKRIQPFGAFVGITAGKDGLVHVSDMALEFVKDPNDIVKIGDKVKVKVKEIDNLGRINLTMLLDGEKSLGGGRVMRSGGSDRGVRRFAGARRGPRDSKGGGPHFPASRFLPSKKRF